MNSECTPLLPVHNTSPLDSIPIYSLALAVSDLVIAKVDVTLTYEQLKSPQINAFLVKPLVKDLKRDLSLGTIYALLANMLQFAKEADKDVAMTGTMNTRSAVCGMVATKLLKEYSDKESLINALTYDFYPLSDGNELKGVIPRWQRISALEVAIIAEAKHFLAHPLVHSVLQEIWNGSILFQSSVHKLHRSKEVTSEFLVTSRRGPGIRYHYEDASPIKLSRLRVPKYRHLVNMASFVVLLGMYVNILKTRKKEFGTMEGVFWIWGMGFVLDEIVAFNDAGISLYVASLWNMFDLIIFLMIVLYVILRLFCFWFASHGHHEHYLFCIRTAYDLLATGSIFLFPRIFSFLDNYPSFSRLIISARRMLIDSIQAMFVICLCCSGFWVAFTTAFARDVFSAEKVAYDLLQIFFGFSPAVWNSWAFYSVIGRTVLVLFMFICNFLIVTILITVLTNSFAEVVGNAAEEHRFLFAVNTISMIKAESSSLFAYTPPLNLLEWLVRPTIYVLPLQKFLVLNRSIIKITHFPILIIIFIYEKLLVQLKETKKRNQEKLLAERKKFIQQRQIYIAPKQRKKKNIRTESRKINNEDLLEEVFQRPYEGTRPSISIPNSNLNSDPVSDQTNVFPQYGTMLQWPSMKYFSDPEREADSEPEDDDERPFPSLKGRNPSIHTVSTRKLSSQYPVRTGTDSAEDPVPVRDIPIIGTSTAIRPRNRLYSNIPNSPTSVFEKLSNPKRRRIIVDSDEDDSDEDDEITRRLDKLEGSMKRIERMLSVLVGKD